jgi:hypothetical protein
MSNARIGILTRSLYEMNGHFRLKNRLCILKECIQTDPHNSFIDAKQAGKKRKKQTTEEDGTNSFNPFHQNRLGA